MQYITPTFKRKDQYKFYQKFVEVFKGKGIVTLYEQPNNGWQDVCIQVANPSHSLSMGITHHGKDGWSVALYPYKPYKQGMRTDKEMYAFVKELLKSEWII